MTKQMFIREQVARFQDVATLSNKRENPEIYKINNDNKDRHDDHKIKRIFCFHNS